MINLDYQEINFRSGKRTIFCNLKDLLLERFGVKTETELQGFVQSNGEYICRCPFCEAGGHTKKKLYVRDTLDEGHCFVCGRAFIGVDDSIKFDLRPPEFMESTFTRPLEISKITDPIWTLEKFQTFDRMSEKGFNYLRSRQPYLGEQLIRALDLRFVQDNVAIPFYYPGIPDPIYYQIRFTGKNNKIRYFFPRIEDKPPYILAPKGSHKIIIVEGVFDAIAAILQSGLEYTVIAAMGSSLSDYQIEMIRNFGVESILIWMDEYDISLKIKRRLMPIFDYIPIGIIPSNGPDPEEVLVDRYMKGMPLVWVTPERFEKQEPKWFIPKLKW